MRLLQINSEKISELIPHSGNMCLLISVLRYDTQSILCTTNTHRLKDNPLKESGLLRAVCGIEYAAQAMALHCALGASKQEDNVRGGRLASVRSAEFFVRNLHDIEDDLEILATLEMGNDRNMIYAFSIITATRKILSGKATIVLLADTYQ